MTDPRFPPSRQPGPGPWCGTTGGYTNHKCRCNRCRAAWNAYMRSWRRKAKR